MKRSLYGIGLVSLFACMCTAQVDIKHTQKGELAIDIDGTPFSEFHFGEENAKPFLTPLRTPDGTIVTRRWPMDQVATDSHDHPHHKGLWVGYGSVNGVNFWEVEAASVPSQGNPQVKGKVALEHGPEIRSGGGSGTVSATFAWLDPAHGKVLEEKRQMTFYSDPNVRAFDVNDTLTAVRDVHFDDTKEGFFAIRLADSMIEKNGGVMTNSAGEQGEKNVWGKRADWVDYEGNVSGQKVGVAIFDNPGNFNHPTRWHARAYGLFAANPFGLKDFDPKSSGTGGHTLKSGESMRFRYRVVIYDGHVTSEKVASWYSEFVKGEKLTSSNGVH